MRVPIGVGLPVVLLGERLMPMTWLALVYVLAGVVVMTWPAKRKGAPACH